MTLRKEQLRKVEEAFKEVYRKRLEVPAGTAWEEKVMRAVRRIGAPPSRPYWDFEGAGHLVWRVTAATCLFALLLMVYATISDLGTASEATRMFFEDPLGVDLVHSLGIV
jgi:hypothetical protein